MHPSPFTTFCPESLILNSFSPERNQSAMETTYCLVFNIKTSKGYEPYARFHLGDDQNFAQQVFKRLRGTRTSTEKCMLQIDFMESSNGLPTHLEVMSCSLEEMTENFTFITKEIFKRSSME
jgi:hypothetical protein